MLRYFILILAFTSQIAEAQSSKYREQLERGQWPLAALDYAFLNEYMLARGLRKPEINIPENANQFERKRIIAEANASVKGVLSNLDARAITISINKLPGYVFWDGYRFSHREYLLCLPGIAKFGDITIGFVSGPYGITQMGGLKQEQYKNACRQAGASLQHVRNGLVISAPVRSDEHAEQLYNKFSKEPIDVSFTCGIRSINSTTINCQLENLFLDSGDWMLAMAEQQTKTLRHNGKTVPTGGIDFQWLQ